MINDEKIRELDEDFKIGIGKVLNESINKKSKTNPAIVGNVFGTLFLIELIFIIFCFCKGSFFLIFVAVPPFFIPTYVITLFTYMIANSAFKQMGL